MLKKVHITNCLSCQDTEIELDTITALIGHNAAGKTNILKTIEWCAQFAVGNMLPNANITNDFAYIFLKYSIELLVDNTTFKYERYNKQALDDQNHEISVLVEQLSSQLNDKLNLIAKREGSKASHYYAEETNIEINNEAPMLSSLLVFIPEKELNPDIKIIFNYLSEIKYYTLDDDDPEIKGLIILDNIYKQWLSKDNKDKSSVVMRLLHLWHEDKELLNELCSLIGENGLNLISKIDFTTLNFPSSSDHIFHIVEFHTTNTKVRYSQLSHGTQRVLILLLALLYDKNSTLLIEQPEDGIHSGLLKKLLPLCFEYAEVYNKQLIIATHSSEVINLFQPESIRLVKMTENGTKVFPLDKERMPFIHDYLKNEGALFDLIESMDDE